jgi:hypothetical protein
VSTNTVQGSFASGELSPGLTARVDLAKYHTGAATMRNFFVDYRGGATTRPGTQFVSAVYADGLPVRLLPFQYNQVQTYCIEAGNFYMRFIVNGGLLLNAGVPFVLATPWAAADLALLKFTQSADTMTLTHPNYQPYDLTRTSATTFALTAISFASSTPAPSGLSVAAHIGGGATTYVYKVTAVDATTGEESLPSASAGTAGGTSAIMSSNGLEFNSPTWSAVSNAVLYNIYRAEEVPGATPDPNSLFGLIGSTQGLIYQDRNGVPYFSKCPPQGRNPFAGSNYPTCCTYFQQRKVFGGTNTAPQTFYATQSGNYKNMNVSIPPRDNNAITGTLISSQVNAIKHFVAMPGGLVILSAGGAWQLSGGTATAALTPSSATAVPQAFNGCSDVPPIVVNYEILFVQSKGAVVRDLSYNFYVNIYTGTDLTVLSGHLFQWQSIKEWAYAEEPFKIIWAVRSDGILLSLTYLKEQEVFGWARHDTQGSYKSVCSISEGSENAVYFVVSRVIGGNTVQYIERMASRNLGANLAANVQADVTKAWFVDCGLNYTGAPVTTLTGLSHLNGQTVACLADGNVQPLQTVVNGTITLDAPSSTVVVGLPYTCQLQTMRLDIGEGQGGTIQGKRKKISAATIRVQDTRGLSVGSTFSTITPFKERGPNVYMGVAIPLMTGDERIVMDPSWNTNGQVCLQISDPLPATVLGIFPEVSIGDS